MAQRSRQLRCLKDYGGKIRSFLDATLAAKLNGYVKWVCGAMSLIGTRRTVDISLTTDKSAILSPSDLWG
jgi:hypothetical protein